MAGIDPRFFYLTLGLLALCTIVGSIVVFRLQREVNEDLAPPTEKELLGPLEKAYYSGLMREEEFRRIQESMARQKGESPAAASKSGKPRVNSPPIVAPDPLAELLPEADSSEAPTKELPITPIGDSDPGPSPG